MSLYKNIYKYDKTLLMTIEVGFVPEGTERKLHITEVERGAFGRFFDYSGEAPIIVDVYCRPDNSSGPVYVFDPESLEDAQGVPRRAYSQENFAGEVTPSATFERDFTTKMHTHGRLILSLIPD